MELLRVHRPGKHGRAIAISTVRLVSPIGRNSDIHLKTHGTWDISQVGRFLLERRPFCNQRLEKPRFSLGHGFAVQELLGERVTGKELPPATHYFDIVPRVGLCAVDIEHHMIMIGHYSVRADVDGKH